MTRPAAVAVSIAGIALIGYVAAGPFITIHQIKSAIEHQDSEMLASNVDFPTLRINLKEQFNALLARETAHEMDSPLGALGSLFVSNLIEQAVDKLVTASGLAALTGGKAPQQPENDDAGKASNEPKNPFQNARYTYDSFDKFSAWVPGEQGEIRFVFTRHDLSWMLTNVMLPLNGMKAAKGGAPTRSRRRSK